MQLGKPAFNDLKEGIVTAPLVYNYVELGEDGEFRERLRRKF